MRTVRTKPYPVRDSYLELVCQFPLRPIRSDAESAAACAILERWFGRQDMDQGQDDYVRSLAILVAEYEHRKHPRHAPATSLPERLASLLETAELTQAAMARVAGVHESQLSQVLRGKRGLSKASVKRLAEHFRLSADYFL